MEYKDSLRVQGQAGGAGWAGPKSPNGQKVITNGLKDVQKMFVEQQKRLEPPMSVYCRDSPNQPHYVDECINLTHFTATYGQLKKSLK